MLFANYRAELAYSTPESRRTAYFSTRIENIFHRNFRDSGNRTFRIDVLRLKTRPRNVIPRYRLLFLHNSFIENDRRPGTTLIRPTLTSTRYTSIDSCGNQILLYTTQCMCT